MSTLVRHVRVIDPYADVDVIDDVVISPEAIEIAPSAAKPTHVIDGRGCVLVPGLVDLHVHFREPGFIHKEDIASGIRAALAGGVTSALVMPNTRPAIDQPKHVDFQLKRAQSCGFDLMAAACASKGLLGEVASDIANLARAGVRAVTDDGHAIHDAKLMQTVLKQCRLHNIVCMQHAENVEISHQASLNEGVASKRLGILGQSSRAESALVKRDLELALQINCRYHVLHLSCQESLRAVRMAKRESQLISCEVAPHHLLLSDSDIRGFDTHKKMNPPLRSKEDVGALLEGLADGTIDALASDHAPHSCKEKRQDFMKAPFGVVGLESAIMVLMTLVKNQGLSLKTALGLMTSGPARVVQRSGRIGTMLGEKALKNAVLLDPSYRAIFSRRNLYGRSYNSPFIGMELFGRVNATFLGGRLVYQSN